MTGEGRPPAEESGDSESEPQPEPVPLPGRPHTDDPSVEYRRLVQMEEGRMAEERAEREQQQQFRRFVSDTLTSMDNSLRSINVSLNELVELMRSTRGAHSCSPPQRGPRRPPRTRGGRCR